MATVFSDDFNRANGALGGNWSTIDGSPSVSSNQFYSASNAGALNSTDPGTADYKVKIDHNTSSNGFIQVYGRSDSSRNTCYFLYCETSVDGWHELYKRVSGTQTMLGSRGTGNFSDTVQTFTLSMEGTTIKGYLDATETISRTDSSVTDGRYHGPRLQSGSYADDYIIEDFSAGGSTGQIKVWNGSAFVAKPVKVYNGSSFVTKPVKVYNGSSWDTTGY